MVLSPQTSPTFQHRDFRFSHPKGTALGGGWVKTFEDILSAFTLLEKLQMGPYKQAHAFFHGIST